MLLLIFLGIVFGSTVFTREPKAYREYELELFWSWKAVLRGDREMLKENLLNMLLLFPAGLLFPPLFHKKLPWWTGLAVGLFISAGIETGQLVLRRGLFEWDDMVHNSLGCMLGVWCSNFLLVRLKVYTNQ
ncbi:VanZ family protein [Blautia sp. OF03-15BH]|uniref:VanZ family protein n=1 Tax=Blautia sp. OF03-15BH TaxID=2292287 RepID=UPI000E4C1C54|nr:VanZ family protein [Blautia sp. OF03-15BH]RGX96930.1 VanZ family protein [Blautia sp. OF03-15BH]